MPNTDTARRPTKAQVNVFMGKLFDPLPDAELSDRELVKLERKARAEAREERRFNWQRGMRHVDIALATVRIQQAQDWLARDGWRGDGRAPNYNQELEAYHAACARQVMIPAPVRADLRWKLATYVFKYKATPEMLAAVAADEARLGLSQGAR